MKTRKNKLDFNATAFGSEIWPDAPAPPKSPNEGGATASEYGKLFNVMLEVEGSAEKVLEKLIRDGIPKRLDFPIVEKNEYAGWPK